MLNNLVDRILYLIGTTRKIEEKKCIRSKRMSSAGSGRPESLTSLLSSLPKSHTTVLVDKKGIRVDVDRTRRNDTKSLSALIPDKWRDALRGEISKPYFAQLQTALNEAYASGNVFPSRNQLFRALSLVPLDAVRVVILGQDPYVRAGQADGLAFSCATGGGRVADSKDSMSTMPPSLANIVRELESEYRNDFKMLNAGDLSGWAEQGVLLLNTALSVAEGEPNSHSEFGWRTLTDRIVQLVAERSPRGVVFMLWGVAAKEKASLVTGGNGHHVLRAAHPSPKTAETGFFGCGHFVRCNQLLAARGSAPIEWGVRKGGAPLKHVAASVSCLANFAKETTLEAEYANIAAKSPTTSPNQSARGGGSIFDVLSYIDDDEAEYPLEDPEEEAQRQKKARVDTEREDVRDAVVQNKEVQTLLAADIIDVVAIGDDDEM
jgi:uracil-DNA glycosylase